MGQLQLPKSRPNQDKPPKWVYFPEGRQHTTCPLTSKELLSKVSRRPMSCQAWYMYFHLFLATTVRPLLPRLQMRRLKFGGGVVSN